MNRLRFPVVLHTDDGVRYGVTVPDLPGCFSAGDSADEALESVREAIGLHLEGLCEGGDDIPVPKAIARYQQHPDFAGGIWALVEVDIARFLDTPEKINIRVPKRILERIDSYAKAQGTTRSDFMVQAVQQVMAR